MRQWLSTNGFLGMRLASQSLSTNGVLAMRVVITEFGYASIAASIVHDGCSHIVGCLTVPPVRSTASRGHCAMSGVVSKMNAKETVYPLVWLCVRCDARYHIRICAHQEFQS